MDIRKASIGRSQPEVENGRAPTSARNGHIAIMKKADSSTLTLFGCPFPRQLNMKPIPIESALDAAKICQISWEYKRAYERGRISIMPSNTASLQIGEIIK